MRLAFCLLLTALACAQGVRAEDPAAPAYLQGLKVFRTDPAELALDSLQTSRQLLVSGARSEGVPEEAQVDLTRHVTYRSRDPQIASVNDEGLVLAKSDGQTVVEIRSEQVSFDVRVTVQGMRERSPVHFENDIVPILSKFACNASGCHGKAEGQNGFKLSVFGFDPPADYRALTMEGRGRRLFPAAPERSLLLRKASGGLPHGGGVRITADRPEYETLARWIAAGAPRGAADAPQVESIEL